MVNAQVAHTASNPIRNHFGRPAILVPLFLVAPVRARDRFRLRDVTVQENGCDNSRAGTSGCDVSRRESGPMSGMQAFAANHSRDSGNRLDREGAPDRRLHRHGA
jgi:hypothetical protein